MTDNCAMVIVSPLDGSPAEAAGLRAGDQVLAIDGDIDRRRVRLLARLPGARRGRHRRDAQRSARRQELDITITRAVIDLQEVSAEMLEDGIGYIRLTSFTDRAHRTLPRRAAGAARRGRDEASCSTCGAIQAASSRRHRAIGSEFIPAGELLFTVESGEDVQSWRVGVLAACSRPMRSSSSS